MRYCVTLGVVLGLLLLGGCSIGSPQVSKVAETATIEKADEEGDVPGTDLANVVSVEVSGDAGAYQFSVEISSPDTGCDQYANWWEVFSEDGELLYRRILLHSHVSEQPFVRSGGPLALDPDTVVWVRAHMHPGGYGGVAFKGSVQAGFLEAELSPAFAADLEDALPLPDGCAF